MSTTVVRPPQRKRELIERAVIRFCGDSGDGMQITGSQFTNTVALYGNDLATLPDFPAEIRAPAGTLARRQRIPGAFLVERRLHARRQRGRADRHESRRAENEYRGPEAQRHSDRQPRRFRRDRSAQGADDRRILSKIIRSTAIACFPSS